MTGAETSLQFVSTNCAAAVRVRTEAVVHNEAYCRAKPGHPPVGAVTASTYSRHTALGCRTHGGIRCPGIHRSIILSALPKLTEFADKREAINEVSRPLAFRCDPLDPRRWFAPSRNSPNTAKSSKPKASSSAAITWWAATGGAWIYNVTSNEELDRLLAMSPVYNFATYQVLALANMTDPYTVAGKGK